MSDFHERLRTLRARCGLTAAELSKKIGVPPTTYRQWESGRAIRGMHYVRLAKALNVTLSELITGEAPKAGGLLLRIETIESQLRKLREDLIALF
jgi:transcriptional regulator with XRE-family HTH domain